MKIVLSLYSFLVLILISSCAHMVQQDIQRKQLKAEVEAILNTPDLVPRKYKK
jgi:hypothetical protein